MHFETNTGYKNRPPLSESLPIFFFSRSLKWNPKLKFNRTSKQNISNIHHTDLQLVSFLTSFAQHKQFSVHYCESVNNFFLKIGKKGVSANSEFQVIHIQVCTGIYVYLRFCHLLFQGVPVCGCIHTHTHTFLSMGQTCPSPIK